MQLRPAGVSDAVVDSAKALEALAALGGNRAYIDAFARASRSRYTTSRGTRERDDDDASDRDSARYAGRALIQRIACAHRSVKAAAGEEAWMVWEKEKRKPRKW